MDYSIESRVARIESDVAHLCTQVADIKTDLRSLRDKLDRLGCRSSEAPKCAGSATNERFAACAAALE